MQNETWDFNTECGTTTSVVGPSSSISQQAKATNPFYRLSSGGDDSRCRSFNGNGINSRTNLSKFGSIAGERLLRSQDRFASSGGLLELQRNTKDGNQFRGRERAESSGSIGGTARRDVEKSEGVVRKSMVFNGVEPRGLLNSIVGNTDTRPTGMYWPSIDEVGGEEKVLGTFNPKKELERRRKSAAKEIQERASNSARKRVSIGHGLSTVNGAESSNSAGTLPKSKSYGSWCGNEHYQPRLQANIHSAMKQGCWSNPSLEDLMHGVHQQKREQREMRELEKRRLMAKETVLQRRGSTSTPVTFHDSGWRYKELEAALVEEQ